MVARRHGRALDIDRPHFCGLGRDACGLTRPQQPRWGPLRGSSKRRSFGRIRITAMPNLPSSHISMARVGTFAFLIAALAALTGCVSDEAASRFLVDPGRYVLYACPEIATAARANATRQREIDALMSKAGGGVGGQLASTMAYRPEYAQLRGEMDQLRKAAADKDCKFTPGGRTSDQVVR